MNLPALPRPPRRLWPALVLAGALAGGAAAADSSIAAGDKLAALPVGTTTYREVVIRSINPRTIVITHAGGMSSIRLRDLSPDWQGRFGYDPVAEAAAERSRPVAPAPLRTRPTAAVEPAGPNAGPFEELIRSFGTPVTLRAEVDLRARFFEMELGVKSQGRRPSCAVFAVVSALEFQSAQLAPGPQKFSEEYLIWATRKTLAHGTGSAATGAQAEPATEDADEGFSLLEVVAAVRGYGVPPQSAMPNTFGRTMAAITDPPPAVVDEARRHQRVAVHPVPGRDNATRIGNVLHALNAGMPVPVGMAWPNYRLLRSGYLSQQQPRLGSGHAVTLVGYRAPGDRIEDVVFIFKNSWGVDWGQGGYGLVTYGYLQQHLQSAVVLEVRRE